MPSPGELKSEVLNPTTDLPPEAPVADGHDVLELRRSSFAQPGTNGIVLGRAPDGLVVVGGSTGAPLSFTKEELRAFLEGVKAGEFDDLTLPDA